MQPLVGQFPLSSCSVLLCLLLYSLSFKVYFVRCTYCYPSCFFFSVCMKYVFQPFTFSLCVSFDLRWVSWRQHTYKSCFVIHSATLCLLVGAFKPFKFKVIFDRYAYSAILWLDCFPLSFFLSFLLILLLKASLLTFVAVLIGC